MGELFTLLFTNRFRFSALGYSNRLHQNLLVRKILITEGKQTEVETDAEFTQIHFDQDLCFTGFLPTCIGISEKPSSRNSPETVMKISQPNI